MDLEERALIHNTIDRLANVIIRLIGIGRIKLFKSTEPAGFASKQAAHLHIGRNVAEQLADVEMHSTLVRAT